MVELFANSGNPDQMPCSMASDLDLHCLPITLLGVARLQWVNLLCLFKLTLLMAGKWYYYIVSDKKGMIFHTNFLHWRWSAWNGIPCFPGKKKNKTKNKKNKKKKNNSKNVSLLSDEIFTKRAKLVCKAFCGSRERCVFTIVQIIFHFLWDHQWAYCGIFEMEFCSCIR